MIFLAFIDDNHRILIHDIYNNHKKDMLKIAYAILQDKHEAQDVVQNAIIKISQSMEKIENRSANEIRGFILTVTKNHAKNVYNRRKKVAYFDNYIEEVENYLTIDDIEKNLLNYEKSKEVAQMMEKINPKYANVLTLRYLHDFTTTEIASILGWSDSNARVVLHRAKML